MHSITSTNEIRLDPDSPVPADLALGARILPALLSSMSSSPKIRSRELEEDGVDAPDAKRTRLDESNDDGDVIMGDATCEVAVVSISELEEQEDTEPQKSESLLPPSHALLNAPPPVYGPDGAMQQIMETDVGISEYVGHDVPRIEGIIKQRYVPRLS